MLNRRDIFKYLSTIPFIGIITSKLESSPVKVTLLTFWYEDIKGNKWVPQTNKDYCEGPPEGFIFQHERSARDIRHIIRTSEGELYVGISTWNNSLVEAMIKSNNYSAQDACIISSIMCERCLNASLFDYNLGGYKRFSHKYNKCNTKCEFC